MEAWLVMLGVVFVGLVLFPWKIFDRPVVRRGVKRPLTDREWNRLEDRYG